MSMSINTNILAMNANRHLNINSENMAQTMERLSSGIRVNRAADDAAGLSISEKLKSQVNGINQASANAQDGISLLQVAEGSLNETHSILQRMRTLSVKAANDTLGDDERTAIGSEITSLVSEVDRIAEQTTYSGTLLLDGNFDKTFQIGANASETVGVTIGGASSTDLAVDALSVADSTSASDALTSIDAAIVSVSGLRSDIGATENRLQHTIANLGVNAENLSAAASRITDADVAAEMVSFTREQILSQSGVAALAQANASQQTILQLLK